MAYLPVESFKTGGYLWFQDLTLYDPYFVLPFICSFSMLASIEVITLEIHCSCFLYIDQLCSNDVTEVMYTQIGYSAEAENLTWSVSEVPFTGSNAINLIKNWTLWHYLGVNIKQTIIKNATTK